MKTDSSASRIEMLTTMTNTCEQCKRKSQMIVKCKCGKMVCITDRDPSDHACSFDFNQHAKTLISIQNPVITSKKLKESC